MVRARVLSLVTVEKPARKAYSACFTWLGGRNRRANLVGSLLNQVNCDDWALEGTQLE